MILGINVVVTLLHEKAANDVVHFFMKKYCESVGPNAK